MKHRPVKQNELFSLKEGKVERKRRYCPRCGDGVWLAVHQNRFYCGKCKYTELPKI